MGCCESKTEISLPGDYDDEEDNIYDESCNFRTLNLITYSPPPDPAAQLLKRNAFIEIVGRVGSREQYQEFMRCIEPYDEAGLHNSLLSILADHPELESVLASAEML